MAGYDRRIKRFGPTGLSGLPADRLPDTRVRSLLNMRTYMPGTIQPRSGIRIQNTASIGSGITALSRLNDPTPFATLHATRFVSAANGHLYSQNPLVVPSPLVDVDNGYGANPVCFVTAAPPQSPRPYLYIASESRQRKINTDAVLYSMGLAQPLLPPSIRLDQPYTTVISDLNVAGACAAAGSAAGAVGLIARVNTTIAAILYDSGTTGYCSINPTASTNIGAGMRVVLNGAETVNVDEFIPAVATTTIASIVYDVGTTGLCWIQPTGSLGTGQLDPVPYATYLVRAGANTSVHIDPATIDGPVEFGLPPDLTPQAAAPRSRVVDFPVNGLVTLGGAGETVRILAIAPGPDGTVAFRCLAANTHAAGDAITGLPTFRCYATTTRSAGDTLVGDAVANTITGTLPSGGTQVGVVGGISSTVAVNGALVGGRATLADDVLHLSIKIDNLTYVESIRVYLDVDAAGAAQPTSFLQNYYIAEWRASDIIAAIQATNAAQVDTITGALPTAVVNDQVDPGPGYTTGSTSGNGGVPAA
jgi:hypothetical protein